FSPALSLLGRAYEQQGQHDQAIDALKKAVSLSKDNPSTLAMLAHAYALAGKKEDARRLLADLEKRARQNYVSPYPLATVPAAPGETDQAFSLLQRAAAERSTELVYVKFDPKLDGLHADPRFGELLRTMNLSP